MASRGAAISVQPLDQTTWRQLRSKAGNQGLNSKTHTAVIADQAGAEHRCFVKLLPDTGKPKRLPAERRTLGRELAVRLHGPLAVPGGVDSF
jgi:hypothetical protein